MLQDLEHLRPLRNLTILSVEDNPVALVPHCRLFAVYVAPSLDILDSQSITRDERDEALRR